jgi:hypothetical protein
VSARGSFGALAGNEENCDNLLTTKFESLVEGEWQRHQYNDTFAREPTSRMTRLRVGPRGRHASLLLGLAAEITSPYKVLYVLHTPRGGSAAGRYESPALEGPQVGHFFRRFAEFFAGDARHDIWLHSGPDDATLVWDRHDLLYAYGPLDQFVAALERRGLRAGEVPVIPSPHSHRYHSEWDAAERELVAKLEWTMTPLRPGDEQ